MGHLWFLFLTVTSRKGAEFKHTPYPHMLSYMPIIRFVYSLIVVNLESSCIESTGCSTILQI